MRLKKRTGGLPRDSVLKCEQITTLPKRFLAFFPGGVVRSVRMIGIVNALMQLLMQGKRLRPAKALELGVSNVGHRGLL